MKAGDRVVFKPGCATGAFAGAKGRVGTLGVVWKDAPFPRASATFDPPPGTAPPLTLRDIPLAYLEPFQGTVKLSSTRKPRRTVLRLKAPVDNRTERARQNEGAAWLRALGYHVLETDTHRGKAICGQCSRDAGRRVYVFCRCGRPAFSPTTGADPGLSDMEVQDARRWPGAPCVSLCVEWKRGPQEEPRPEQAQRQARGETVIVWDLPTLAAALIGFEHSLGVVPLAAVRDIARKAIPPATSRGEQERNVL